MPLTALHVQAANGDATALRAAIKEGGCELDAREKDGDTSTAILRLEQLYPLVSRVAARPGSTLVRKTAQWILDRWGAREPLAEPGR